MKFAVITSKQDTAGMNIAGFIKNLPVHYIDEDIVYAENIDKEVDADFIIFISKHQGKQGKILSIHAPGNFRNADFGGIAGKVCPTSGTAIKQIFNEISENTPEGWQATLEVTHHGPYVEKPCCFVEIGSAEKEWKDKKAGKAIATAIENAIILLQDLDLNNLEYETAIGMGGPHYCPSFNKIQLNSRYALSHIISGNQAPITLAMIKEAISKTIEKVSIAILDWKGLKGRDRQEVVNLASELGLKILRTSQVEK